MLLRYALWPMLRRVDPSLSRAATRRPSPVPTEVRIDPKGVAFAAARAALHTSLPLTFGVMGVFYAILVPVALSGTTGHPASVGFSVLCGLVSAVSFFLAGLHNFRPRPPESTRRWVLVAGALITLVTCSAFWLSGDPGLAPYLMILVVSSAYFMLDRIDYSFMLSGALLALILGCYGPGAQAGWGLPVVQLAAAGFFGTLLHEARRRQVVEFARLHLENEQQDRELRASEARWRGFADKAFDIIAVLNREHQTVYVNETFVEKYGYPLQLVLGRDPVELLLPEHRQVAHDVRNRWWEGSEEIMTFASQTARDEVLWVEVSSTLTLQADGEPNLILVSRDVTERRALEERLRSRQKDEGLSLMAAGVAHDFNNLLTVVLGETELASLDVADSEVQESLDRVRDAALKARELTLQILAYSGHAVPQRVPLDLSQLAEATIKLVRNALPSSVKVESDLMQEIPAIEGDTTQIQQVVMNLLWNAAEASGSMLGAVDVLTGIEHIDQEELDELHPAFERLPGRYAYVSVTDSGRGMDSDTMVRVFDPFFSTKQDGRGLGLAALIGIVRAHQGGVAVRSSPGGGSTFRVFFPVTDEPILPKPASGPVTVGGAGRVLVVDDEEAVREVVAALLESIGYNTVSASSGIEAVEFLSRSPQRYCMAVLDMAMPDLDGVATLELLRSHAPELPVLMSSGFSEVKAMARLKGVSDVWFIQKPYTRKTLALILEEILTSEEAP